MTTHQLTLGLSLSDDATFLNFYQGDNAAVVAALKACLAGQGEWFIYLWGDRGVGCSHLLQACCHQVGEGHAAVYFDFCEVQSFSPAILEGLEEIHLVCLDNIQAVLGCAEWEEALFYFYNRMAKRRTAFIAAGKMAPAQLPCQLADLRSRLSAGLTFRVKQLNDQQKCAALMMRASRRGMIFPESSAHYLLHHASRSFTELLNILDVLEQATLIEQRRITVPFIKSVLYSRT